MSARLFELKYGDDARELRAALSPTTQPDEAILIVSGNGLRKEYAMEYQDDTGKWTYQFTDSDFEDLSDNSKDLTYKAEIYGTFSDGSNATYPTRGVLSIKVYTRL